MTFGEIKINRGFHTLFTSERGFVPFLKCSNTEAINLQDSKIEVFSTDTKVEIYEPSWLTEGDVDKIYKEAGRHYITERNILQSHIIDSDTLEDSKTSLNEWLETNYDKEIKTIEFEKVDTKFIFIIYYYIKKLK